MSEDAQYDATEKFHQKINRLMYDLVNSMRRLQEFEIDLRNWHESLKMKGLKKMLDNIKKDNTIEMSLVSKRQQISGEDEDIPPKNEVSSDYLLETT